MIPKYHFLQKKYRSWHNVILSKEKRKVDMELYIHLHSMRFLKKQEFQNIFFLYCRRKLTFWSAFSFSSKLWVAVSRLVWVWANSFSNCCIFFSRASTSSLAYLATIRQRTKMFFSWNWISRDFFMKEVAWIANIKFRWRRSLCPNFMTSYLE